LEQSSSLHRAYLEWNKKKIGGAYLGSILVKNENLPLFETYFGLLDYDWLLRVTKNRVCKIIEPVVIRYINGKNLSLNSDYRKKDFYMIMLYIDGNLDAMKRLCGTRARYFYYVGNAKMARFYFRQSKLDWKIFLYYITSYIPFLRKIIIKKFRVFG